jgi:hypothetical protein
LVAKGREKILKIETSGDEIAMSETEQWTMPIREAGKRFFGLGAAASYRAAANGDIPTITVGKIRRANVVALKRRFETASEEVAT